MKNCFDIIVVIKAKENCGLGQGRATGDEDM